MFTANINVMWMSIANKHQSAAKRTDERLFLQLALSDLSMGLYLIIIVSAILFYSGRFFIIANSWKQSFLCSLASGFAMFSFEIGSVSPLMISVMRCLYLFFPLRHIKLQNRFDRKLLIAIFLTISIMCLLLLLFSEYIDEFNLKTNNLCLWPNNYRVKSDSWITYSIIFVMINSLITVFTFILNILILKLAKKKSITQRKTKAFKFISQDFINMMLCFTVAVVVSLNKEQISTVTSIWITIACMSLKALINPMTYILRGIDQKKDT